MNQAQFLKRLEEVKMEAVEISRRKNADYASEEDPFKNFRACEPLGISAEQAIIVRMSDKLMRAANLLQRPAQVQDEKITDTLRDLANYADILAIYLENRGTSGGSTTFR